MLNQLMCLRILHHGAAGPECWTVSLSGAGDLRGDGCVFHQGGMGSAGPCSESPLQGYHGAWGLQQRVSLTRSDTAEHFP
uniref:Uncharacterized protein n=1 Tax=Gopherus agassizii TaxID=38772 RepID=A0A452H1R3_9SAUR